MENLNIDIRAVAPWMNISTSKIALLKMSIGVVDIRSMIAPQMTSIDALEGSTGMIAPPMMSIDTLEVGASSIASPLRSTHILGMVTGMILMMSIRTPDISISMISPPMRRVGIKPSL